MCIRDRDSLVESAFLLVPGEAGELPEVQALEGGFILIFRDSNHPLKFRTVFGPAAGNALFLNKDKLRRDGNAVLFGLLQNYPQLGVRGQFRLLISADANVGGSDV